MALRTLSQFKSPLPKLPSPSPSPKQPNHISSFLRFPSRRRRPAGAVALSPPPFSCSSGYGDYQPEKTAHSRPPEIPWSKDLANSVHLIGNIGASVQIKQLSSGKVLAWTSLGVKKSSSETSWINLTFWDELAHIAFQHVEKGNQVYVSGRLVSDTTEGEDDKPRVFYKVVVQQLSFIEKTIPSVSFYEQRTDSVNSEKSPQRKETSRDGRNPGLAARLGEDRNKISGVNEKPQADRTNNQVEMVRHLGGQQPEETEAGEQPLDRAVRDTPQQEHKPANRPLRLRSEEFLQQSNPIRIRGLESTFVEFLFWERGPKNENYASNSFASVSTVELWQAFFANPVDWWDNRKNKRNPKYPDFKHKDTGEALWIEGRSNPSWVKGQLAILDERMGSFQGHGSNSTGSLLIANDFTSF
ncbi:hypothetical protein KSP40_PGU006658 [Platanthera guangdongensis]|uniref:Uncharacterized protein n=1 Tax=Platanthera guangdongensis TaxID=2320717 RepID=A0ABR2LXN3_9ASPA